MSKMTGTPVSRAYESTAKHDSRPAAPTFGDYVRKCDEFVKNPALLENNGDLVSKVAALYVLKRDHNETFRNQVLFSENIDKMAIEVGKANDTGLLQDFKRLFSDNEKRKKSILPYDRLDKLLDPLIQAVIENKYDELVLATAMHTLSEVWAEAENVQLDNRDAHFIAIMSRTQKITDYILFKGSEHASERKLPAQKSKTIRRPGIEKQPNGFREWLAIAGAAAAGIISGIAAYDYSAKHFLKPAATIEAAKETLPMPKYTLMTAAQDVTGVITKAPEAVDDAATRIARAFADAPSMLPVQKTASVPVPDLEFAWDAPNASSNLDIGLEPIPDTEIQPKPIPMTETQLEPIPEIQLELISEIQLEPVNLELDFSRPLLRREPSLDFGVIK